MNGVSPSIRRGREPAVTALGLAEAIALTESIADRAEDRLLPRAAFGAFEEPSGTIRIWALVPGSPDPRTLAPSPLALEQLEHWVGIPAAFGRRLRENFPGLWVETFNRLNERACSEFPEEFLLRQLAPERKGEPWILRAVLSPAYGRIDDAEVLHAVELAGTFEGMNDVTVTWTPEWMRLRILSARRKDVTVGDAVQAAVTVTNSEVGLGAFSVRPSILRLVCTNGMVVPEAGQRLRRIHLGPRRRPFGPGIEARRYPEALDVGAMARMILQALEHPRIEAFLDSARAAAETPVPDPAKALEDLRNDHRIPRTILDTIGRELPRDPSLWDLANAVAAAARDLDDPVMAHGLETLAGALVAGPAALDERPRR